MSLLDKRVVFVTGKGGVGKTTVSATLAVAAARTGRRVLLCETAGAARVPSMFGLVPRGYEVMPLGGGLHTLSITSAKAIEDYILKVLHFRRLYTMVFKNRIMGPFVDAVPGLHDLIQLGKVFDLERTVHRGRPEWDLLIVDAPATGHGLGMLTAPRSMMELTVAGPFYENARDVAALYEDASKTALVLVALPEEMPVNETLELHQRLGAMRTQVGLVVLNEMHPTPVPDVAFYRSVRAHLQTGDDAARDLVDLADAAVQRGEAQARARGRLARLGAPMVELPFLFRRDLGRADLESFVSRVGSAL